MNHKRRYQLVVVVRLNIEEDDRAVEEQIKLKVRACDAHRARRTALKRLHLEGYLVTRFLIVEEEKRKV